MRVFPITIAGNRITKRLTATLMKLTTEALTGGCVTDEAKTANAIMENRTQATAMERSPRQDFIVNVSNTLCFDSRISTIVSCATNYSGSVFDEKGVKKFSIKVWAN